MPELKKRGYDERLALGSLATAGTLGIPIPPSITMVVYAGRNFREGLMSATRVSCMIMFILAGAAFLTKTMACTGIPRELAEWVNGLGLSPYALIAVLVVVCPVLGTVLDGISTILLTAAVVLITVFPQIVTILPDLVMGKER